MKLLAGSESWCGWSSCLTPNTRRKEEAVRCSGNEGRGRGRGSRGFKVLWVYKKRLGLCCVFPLLPQRQPRVFIKEIAHLKTVAGGGGGGRETGSYSDIEAVQQKEKTTTRSCEASAASFSSLSQPGNPQTGAAVFLGFGAQSSGPKTLRRRLDSGLSVFSFTEKKKL